MENESEGILDRDEPSSPGLDSKEGVLDSSIFDTCTRLTEYLRTYGFSVLSPPSFCAHLHSFEFEQWLQSVMEIAIELCEKMSNRQRLLIETSSLRQAKETENDLMQNKIQDLTALLEEKCNKEKSLLARLDALETAKSHHEGGDQQSKITECVKKMKSLETLLQENERRYRQKEQDFERLRKKMKAITERNHSNSSVVPTLLEKGDLSLSIPSIVDSLKSGPSKSLKRRGMDKDGLVSLLETIDRNRRELLSKNKELEAQVKELLHSYKLNLQERSFDKSSLSGIHSIDEDRVVEANRTEIEDFIDREAELKLLQGQLRAVSSLREEAEESIEKLRRTNLSLHEEIDRLQQELELRPSVKLWNQSQNQLKELEAKVHDLVLLRAESEDLMNWRRHLSTSERIKVDKRNHELGLWLLESLPKNSLVETVQMVCRELDLNDISEIKSSLDKLKTVVRVVPRLERFISRTTEFLFEKNSLLLKRLNIPITRSMITMENALSVLERWWGLCERCIELEEFRDEVYFELYRGQQMLSGVSLNSESQLHELWESRWRQEWLIKPRHAILQQIRDVTDLQVELLGTRDTLRSVDRFVNERPDLVVNRIIGHIQYLFEVKAIDGILPKLNQVYIFTEEMKNFLFTAKGLLRLQTSLSNAALCGEILQNLSLNNER